MHTKSCIEIPKQTMRRQLPQSLNGFCTIAPNRHLWLVPNAIASSLRPFRKTKTNEKQNNKNPKNCLPNKWKAIYSHINHMLTVEMSSHFYTHAQFRFCHLHFSRRFWLTPSIVVTASLTPVHSLLFVVSLFEQHISRFLRCLFLRRFSCLLSYKQKKNKS